MVFIYLNLCMYIYSLVVEVAAGFSDGYIANADNFFLYDNLQEKRFTYLAADFDMTMGNTIVKLANQWSGNYTQYPGFSLRPLTQKIIQVPVFKSQFEQLLQNVIKELVNPKIANQHIDDLVSYLREDVEWDDALPKVSEYRMGEFITKYGDMPPPAVMKCVKYPSMLHPVPFDVAVNGPIHQQCATSVKEWIKNISKNVQLYFDQHPSSS